MKFCVRLWERLTGFPGAQKAANLHSYVSALTLRLREYFDLLSVDLVYNSRRNTERRVLYSVLQLHTFNGSFFLYQKGKTSKRQWVAVASAGPYTSLHLAPDRQPCQHPTTHVFTGRMPFLLSNQQCESTEGKYSVLQMHNKVEVVAR